MKPYFEAGPTFRAVGASVAQHISGTGFSAGIGLESRIGHLRVAPEVRYTHWGSDGFYNASYHTVSSPNQVEVLIGLSTAPTGFNNKTSIKGGLSKYFSLGVKGGLPFTSTFIVDEFSKMAIPSIRCGDFSPTACTPANPTMQTYKASRNYLVGPMIEVHLPTGISIEANLASRLLLPSIQAFDSWQFPVVGKYKVRTPPFSPYLEAGPTFRKAASPLSRYLSTTGVTSGLGAEAMAWKCTSRQRCALFTEVVIPRTLPRSTPREEIKQNFCWDYPIKKYDIIPRPAHDSAKSGPEHKSMRGSSY